jgi:hypothetical protein
MRFKADNIIDSSQIEGDKAEAIRFVGGKYSGMTGWLRESKRERGSTYYYVFVDLDDGTVYKTYTSIKYCKDLITMPSSFVEALFVDHATIESEMDKLCQKLSEFDLQEDDGSELSLAFANKLYDAMLKRYNSQSKCRVVRTVNYPRPDTYPSYVSSPPGSIV